jgi:hypothetical protein
MSSTNKIPQSMFSSRLQTNHLFKGDESKTIVKRETLIININDEKAQMQGLNIGKSNNNNVEGKRGSMSLIGKTDNLNASQYEKKSMKSFDDRIIIRSKEKNWIGCGDRFINSNKCIHFYTFLIIYSLIVCFYSIVAYLRQLNQLPVVISEAVLIIILIIEIFIKISTEVK